MRAPRHASDSRQSAFPLAGLIGIHPLSPSRLQAFKYGPFGGKPENARTKRIKLAQRRARKARRKGEAR